MQKQTATTWVEIDSQAFEHNLASYKKIIGKAFLAPVIKSNAYGHGIELIAKICDQSEFVEILCVVSVNEALFLRDIGIQKPILVLSIPVGNLQEAIAKNISLIAYDREKIFELNNLAKSLNTSAKIHLKVDTGLSRMGLNSENTLNLIEEIRKLPFISIQGIFSHLAKAESLDQTFTNNQIKQFNFLLQQLDKMDVEIPLKHATCSAAATANAESHYNVVRTGLGLYGLWPSEENKQVTQERFPGFTLKPVLTWKTKIIQIKEIPAGSHIGYDCTHQVQETSKIAIIPIGYWDGFDRKLSNRGKVMINNQIAPVIGRIAMNLTTIDITNLNVSINDEVILIGDYPEVTADDFARRCDTINYEVVTRINPLLPRIIKGVEIK